MPTTLQTILDQFREDKRNNRDLGDRFERLIHRFIELDPLYAERFDKVWMWNDWPEKGNVGDIGIDLVARDRADGEYCAIQCKFYLPENTISKGDVDTFFTACGDPRFTSALFVSTTEKWNKNALHALHHQSKPVNRIGLNELAESPIDWSQFDARRPDALKLLPKKKLRPHQTAALNDVIQGLDTTTGGGGADRGKLIMACGTGKTFTALKIAETLAPALSSGAGGGGHVLFLVPSLSLLSQTLREWTAEADQPFHALAVCSDVSIGTRRVAADDSGGDITLQDLAFPATTNAKELNAQYRSLTGGIASKASKTKGQT